MHTPPRLRLSTLDAARLATPGSRAVVVGPAVDPRGTRVGIVHLGVGAFHRSHQAVFTEDAAAAAGED
ncbi:MAG: mannitol dehydrogenase family protein, partial [Actinomycetota bacterium]|nr:mannitol dehydrogenase family protein [Actinomycetota bacterium]